MVFFPRKLEKKNEVIAAENPNSVLRLYMGKLLY